MAAIFAVRDGMADARTGRSPYFWTVLHDPGQRRERLREGVKATLKVVLLGVVIDAIYSSRCTAPYTPAKRSASRSCWGSFPIC